MIVNRWLIDDLDIEVTHKDIRNLYLRVSPPDGLVRVSAPSRMQLDNIHRFILSRRDWIKRQQAKLRLQTQVTEKQCPVLDDGYRKYLKETIPNLIDKYETIMGVKVSDFIIRKMKTRWGSCNTQTRRICLNLELAKRSVQCLEYVVVHEMVHLLEPSHNKRFYALMNIFMPDWKDYKTALKSMA